MKYISLSSIKQNVIFTALTSFYLSFVVLNLFVMPNESTEYLARIELSFFVFGTLVCFLLNSFLFNDIKHFILHISIPVLFALPALLSNLLLMLNVTMPPALLIFVWFLFGISLALFLLNSQALVGKSLLKSVHVHLVFFASMTFLITMGLLFIENKFITLTVQCVLLLVSIIFFLQLSSNSLKETIQQSQNTTNHIRNSSIYFGSYSFAYGLFSSYLFDYGELGTAFIFVALCVAAFIFTALIKKRGLYSLNPAKSLYAMLPIVMLLLIAMPQISGLIQLFCIAIAAAFFTFSLLNLIIWSTTYALHTSENIIILLSKVLLFPMTGLLIGIIAGNTVHILDICETHCLPLTIIYASMLVFIWMKFNPQNENKPIKEKLDDLNLQKIELNDGTLRISKKIQHFANHYNLTDRETEIVELFSQGVQISDMHDLLFIAPATVRSHLHHIYQKTDTDSQEGLRKLLPH